MTLDREYVYVCGTFQNVTNCDGHVVSVDNVARFSVVKQKWEAMGGRGKTESEWERVGSSEKGRRIVGIEACKMGCESEKERQG